MNYEFNILIIMSLLPHLLFIIYSSNNLMMNKKINTHQTLSNDEYLMNR
jgi:hypothetical protein